MQDFFLYMLHRIDPADIDPLKALSMDFRPWRRYFWDQPKEMWSTAAILLAANRTKDAGLYHFEPAQTGIGDDGLTSVLAYNSWRMPTYKRSFSKMCRSTAMPCAPSSATCSTTFPSASNRICLHGASGSAIL